MPDIRKPTPQGVLNLPTVGDFTYSYEFEDGRDFPAGSELYFLLGEPDETQTQWDFDISGPTARIKKEHEVVALVDVGTKFWLVYRDTTTSPTTEDEALTGTVEKVNAPWGF